MYPRFDKDRFLAANYRFVVAKGLEAFAHTLFEREPPKYYMQ